MASSRISSVWRSFLVCALIILFLLFFLGGPHYYSSRHFKAIWNLGHILFFALLPYCLFSNVKGGDQRFTVQSVLTIGLCIGMGVLVELFQYDFRRTPDVQDVFRDVIGGLVGIFFLLPSRRRLGLKILRVLQAATICLVGFQVYPVIVAYTDEYLARSRFPVLSDFETPWEIQRWTGNAERFIDDRVYLAGRHAMGVQLDTNQYSGVTLFYFPGNWEGARRFRFSVYNPAKEALPIVCRINDREHHYGSGAYDDRFNRDYVLQHGWSTIEIDIEDIRDAPKLRSINLKDICEVGIFAVRLPRARVMYVDEVGLVY